jgi:hypothetical protein
MGSWIGSDIGASGQGLGYPEYIPKMAGSKQALRILYLII